MKNILLVLLWGLFANATVRAQFVNKGGAVMIKNNTAVKVMGLDVRNTDGGALTNNGRLECDQNLFNDNGAVLGGDGRYTIGGDWNNSAIFEPGGSTVIFNGSSGSTVITGGDAFYKVVLDKASGHNLVLADDMTILDTLDFQSPGNFVLPGDFNLQVVDIIGYDATRHIRTTGTGYLVRRLDGDPVVFPVGNSTYNPATLTNAGAHDRYFVRVVDGALNGGYSGSAIQNNAVGRSWFIEEDTAGGSDLSLSLQWNGNEELSGFDRNMSYVSHYDAGSWDSQPATAAAGSGPYTQTRSGITMVSPFTVLGANFQSLIDILGQITWKGDGIAGVKDATVTADGDMTGFTTTDAAGDYALSLSGNGNVSIKPSKQINQLNGITVADALAIQQHITNINQIADPYAQIAMDVNHDNQISTLDAVLINQTLLGNPAVANIFNKYWRFVPKSYTLSVPPWGFPEQIELSGVAGNQTGQDFYGVKVGDVVAEFADPANFGHGMDPLVWRAQDRELVAGQDLTVTFAADFLENISAFQFALRFDPQQLELEDMEQLSALPLNEDHFGLFQAHLGEIRAVWSHHTGYPMPQGAEAFHLHFKVLQSGAKLSEVLGLDEGLLQGLVFNSDLEYSDVELRFDPLIGTGAPSEAFRMLENLPNPFVQTTRLRFSLPMAGTAQIRVLDAAGRELYRLEKFYSAGSNTETLQLGAVSTSGVLLCELSTPYGTLTRKIIRAE